MGIIFVQTRWALGQCPIMIGQTCQVDQGLFEDLRLNLYNGIGLTI